MAPNADDYDETKFSQPKWVDKSNTDYSDIRSEMMLYVAKRRKDMHAGITILAKTTSLGDKAQVCGGAANCKTLNEFRTWIAEDISSHGTIHSLDEQRANDFGIDIVATKYKPAAGNNAAFAKIVDYIAEAKINQKALDAASFPLSSTDFPSNTHAEAQHRHCASLVIGTYRILKAYPERFICTQERLAENPRTLAAAAYDTYSGFVMDDWFAAFNVQRYVNYSRRSKIEKYWADLRVKQFKPEALEAAKKAIISKQATKQDPTKDQSCTKPAYLSDEEARGVITKVDKDRTAVTDANMELLDSLRPSYRMNLKQQLDAYRFTTQEAEERRAFLRAFESMASLESNLIDAADDDDDPNVDPSKPKSDIKYQSGARELPELSSELRKALLANASKFVNLDRPDDMKLIETMITTQASPKTSTSFPTENDALKSRENEEKEKVLNLLSGKISFDPDEQDLDFTNVHDLHTLFDKEATATRRTAVAKAMADPNSKTLGDSVLNAIEDGVLGSMEDPDDLKPVLTADHNDIQVMVNDILALSLTSVDAIDILSDLFKDSKLPELANFRRECPEVGGRVLMDHQCNGVVWILMIWLRLGFGALCDDMGLGKSFTLIVAVYAWVHMHQLSKQNPESRGSWPLPPGRKVTAAYLTSLCSPDEIFRPTFLIVPSQAYPTWIGELELVPTVDAGYLIWYSDEEHAGERKRRVLPRDALNFCRRIEEFDTTDPATALRFILTCQSTLRGRSLVLLPESSQLVALEALERFFQEFKQKLIDIQNDPTKAELPAADPAKSDNDNQRMMIVARNNIPRSVQHCRQLAYQRVVREILPGLQKEDWPRKGVQSTGNKKNKKKQRKRRAQEDDDDDDDEAIPQEMVDRVWSKICHTGGLVLVDEAHLYRNLNTQNQLALTKLGADRIMLATGTLAYNKLMDLRGTLSILDSIVCGAGATGLVADEKAFVQSGNARVPGVFDELARAFKADKAATIAHLPSAIDDLIRKAFLTPASFQERFSAKNKTATAVRELIPPLLSVLSLRRVRGQLFQKSDQEWTRIADDVPAADVMTVELRLNRIQAAMYGPAHAHITEYCLYGGGGKSKSGDQVGHRSLDAHRALLNIAVDPRLAYLNAKQGLVGDTDAWTERIDYGYSTLWKHTLSGRKLLDMPSESRFSIVLEMMMGSQTFAMLGHLIKRVCIDEDSKLLVFTNTTMVHYETELFAFMLFGREGFLHIRSADSQDDRIKTIKAFNDPTDSRKLLIISGQCGSASLNLHQACHNMAILGPPEAFALILQEMCRIIRKGQKKKPNVWNLVIKYAYDDAVRSSCESRYTDVILSSVKDIITDDLRKKICAAYEHVYVCDDIQRLPEYLLTEWAYAKLLGQKEPTRFWFHTVDVFWKVHLDGGGHPKLHMAGDFQLKQRKEKMILEEPGALPLETQRRKRSRTPTGETDDDEHRQDEPDIRGSYADEEYGYEDYDSELKDMYGGAPLDPDTIAAKEEQALKGIARRHGRHIGLLSGSSDHSDNTTSPVASRGRGRGRAGTRGRGRGRGKRPNPAGSPSERPGKRQRGGDNSDLSSAIVDPLDIDNDEEGDMLLEGKVETTASISAQKAAEWKHREEQRRREEAADGKEDNATKGEEKGKTPKRLVLKTRASLAPALIRDMPSDHTPTISASFGEPSGRRNTCPVIYTSRDGEKCTRTQWLQDNFLDKQEYRDPRQDVANQGKINELLEGRCST